MEVSNAETVWCNAMIDLSHFNKVEDFNKVKESGINVVIHKATQGLTFNDKTYQTRRKQAESAGLQWGAYHFGTGDNGTQQADHFLSQIGFDVDITVLDIEENPNGVTMGVEQATDFVLRFQERTGYLPIIYSRANFLEDNHFNTPYLTQTKLWIARWGPQVTLPKGWPSDSLVYWQYSDGQHGPEPRGVPGVKGYVDRDAYKPLSTDCNSRNSLYKNRVV